jgi:TPR repeat protein
MDARVFAQVSSTGSRETSGRACTGRSLAEMPWQIYPRNRSRGLVRPDVAGGTVKVASIRSHLAERATDWNPCRTDYRSCTMDGLRSAQAGRHGETAARENTMVMRLFGFVRICVFGVGMAAGTGAALALDDTVFDDGSGVKAESSPWDVFKFGYSAYQSGHKDQAAEAYRYAAEKGQIGATWKLARMYASGDGVARDDYEAYKFFSEIVEQDVEPGSRDESYVSDALVALGGYMKTGIPGTPVQADPMAAQEYYMRAAANYRNPSAQYEMGKIFLKGDGGVKASVRQAGRWFQLAAEKGHAGAQATLGNLLFQSGKVVRGLAMMTAALERATPADQPWIRGMQEEAFSLAGEADRRTAIALAQDILGKGDSDSQ